MKSLKMYVLAGVFILTSINTVNAQSEFHSLKQPNGATFQAVERGDEWLRFFETPEGYIVQRGDDGYFHYFDINASGEFVSTNLKAGIDTPQNVPVRPYDKPAVLRALQQKIDAYNAAAEKNRQRYLEMQRAATTNVSGKVPGVPTTTDVPGGPVTLNVGVLLVEFNGRLHYEPEYEVSDFENMLFSDDYYITDPDNGNLPLSPDGEEVFGSLRDYFEFQSHGILTITGQVINPDNNGIPVWLNMGNSAPYNTLGESDDLLEDAINTAITDSSWNCNYDVVVVLVSQDDWTWYTTGVAWFQSSFSSGNFPGSFDFDNWFGGYVFNERNAAEYRDSDDATFSHIGINCHEMFHVIGWGMPNILNLGETIWQHSGGADWSSMNIGYRTGPLRKAASPGDLDPIARILLEWASPTHVTTNLLNEIIEYREDDDNLNETFDFYRLSDPNSSEEFIVENRQYSGFNSFLPEWWEAEAEGGLLVWWHNDPNGVNREIRNADNDTEASGALPHLSDGDLGDPFPGSSNNTSITPFTTPSTATAAGASTGLGIANISASANDMTADLFADFSPPDPPNITSIDIILDLIILD